MTPFDVLKGRIAELINSPVIQFGDDGAHGEWKSNNNIRYCNVFLMKGENIAATVAICKPNQDDQTAIKEAIERLKA